MSDVSYADTPSRQGGRRFAKSVAFGLGILLVFCVFRQFPVGRASLAAWAQQLGPWRFMLMATIACSAGVPRQAIALAAGYANGTWGGSALALVCETLACATNFGWARFVARDWVQGKLDKSLRLKKWIVGLDDALAANPFFATLSLRLLPVGNNVLLNLAAGVSRVPWVGFICGSALGYVPQTLIFALLGAGIAVDRWMQFVAALALFFASLLLAAFIMARRRRA